MICEEFFCLFYAFYQFFYCGSIVSASVKFDFMQENLNILVCPQSILGDIGSLRVSFTLVGSICESIIRLSEVAVANVGLSR